MTSANFMMKLGFLQVLVKARFVLLNNKSSAINYRMLKVSVDIQGFNIVANFEVWKGMQYNIILEMAWLCQVNAHIACKGVVHGKLLD